MIILYLLHALVMGILGMGVYMFFDQDPRDLARQESFGAAVLVGIIISFLNFLTNFFRHRIEKKM